MEQQPQLNPELETVQLWRGLVMITAELDREHAEQMVANGKAYVISPQAVGQVSE